MSFKRKVSKTDPSPSKRQKIATNSETKTIYVTDISDYIEVIDGMEQVGSSVEVDTDTGKSLSEALILASTNPHMTKDCSLNYESST